MSRHIFVVLLFGSLFSGRAQTLTYTRLTMAAPLRRRVWMAQLSMTMPETAYSFSAEETMRHVGFCVRHKSMDQLTGTAGVKQINQGRTPLVRDL